MIAEVLARFCVTDRLVMFAPGTSVTVTFAPGVVTRHHVTFAPGTFVTRPDVTFAPGTFVTRSLAQP